MSVVIKDMDMPNSCQECPFNSDNAWCLVPGNWRDRYYIPRSGRSEVCPLSELPDHTSQETKNEPNIQVIEEIKISRAELNDSQIHKDEF